MSIGKGRPTKYTAAIAEKICERLAMGETLRSICRDEDFPHEATVRAWALDDYQGFYTQYSRARQIGLDCMADEVLHIADTPKDGVVKITRPTGEEIRTGDMTEHRRLQVDTRKWYLSKLAPKRYDKPIEDENTGDVIESINIGVKDARQNAPATNL